MYAYEIDYGFDDAWWGEDEPEWFEGLDEMHACQYDWEPMEYEIEDDDDDDDDDEYQHEDL